MVVATEIDSLIQAMVDTLVAEYQPERVILFGSYAYGQPRPYSDLDLFIVKETPETFLNRTLQVKDILRPVRGHFPLDVIVMTPQELAKRLDIGDHFIEDILRKGKLLYTAGATVYLPSGLPTRQIREETPPFHSAPNPEYAQDWLKLASQDLNRVRILLGEDDHEGAAFHLQQAVEKLLKGYLLAHGWRLDRIHHLDRLLDDAVNHDASLETYRPVCEVISSFYGRSRYPLPDADPPTESEVLSALADVQPLIDTLRQALTTE